MALYGGPSYNYTYQQELDPTEVQYFQEQALQESQQLQQGFLGQSNYQVNQSFSLSYRQKQHRGSVGFSTSGMWLDLSMQLEDLSSHNMPLQVLEQYWRTMKGNL